MRDYGVNPIIWDGDNNCEHKWGNSVITLKHKSGETNPGKESWFKDKGASDDKGSQFCSKCGAWRGSLGLEPTFDLYIKHLCDIFDEVKRVLRKDGTLWVNLGDTYSNNGEKSSHHGQGKSTLRGGHVNQNEQWNKNTSNLKVNLKSSLPSKSLTLIPFRFAIEMVNRGWICRNVIIWHKPNCMPSSAKDRFTVDFEYLFFFVKNKKYWFEQQFEPHTTLDDLTRRTNKYWSDDIADGGTGKQNKGRDRREFYGEQGRNKRAVWTIKYKDTLQEAKMRQGMNRERGKGLVEKRDLPKQKEFVDKIRVNFAIDELVKKTKLPRTHIEHWFRYDDNGFAYPSKEDWEKVKTDLFPELLEVYYEPDDIKSNSNGRNKRCVWTIPTKPYPEAHFAVYPAELIRTCIKAGCPRYVCKKCGKAREKIYETKINPDKWKKTYRGKADLKGSPYKRSVSELYAESLAKEKIFQGYSDCGCNAGFRPGVVLDPFAGSGTTLEEAIRQGKDYIGIELKDEYIELIEKRLSNVQVSLI